MENLLSLSFDYLSSCDGVKIRKGLRQLEGLLAQICLSRTTTAAERRRSVIQDGVSKSRPKDLASLSEDPAFREFFKLQEGFEWNVAIRLISCLERLLGKGSNGQNDLLLVSTLDLLRGILLIHPPSRSLFARDIYMNLLLDLLDPSSCPAVQASAILTLVTALLEQPNITRCFENLDGLLTVTSLFKNRGTSREVKLKLVEFLYFYLMPETPYGGQNHVADEQAGLRRSSSKSSRVGSGGRGKAQGDEGTRTTEEKQRSLGRYLNNVEDLVEDLKETAPFGASFG
ncbi:MAG: hypothetical protein LQ350_001703 [Teloschistes chrysophthalmus]|nr:MAG: hypothetical protein LQ350_001703 [Niorma chrysophthalma]